MTRDRAGRCHPHVAVRARRGNVLQRATQMTQPVGLPDEIRMQRDAHHERLRMAAAVRLFEHLVELVDDHVGEMRVRPDGGRPSSASR